MNEVELDGNKLSSEASTREYLFDMFEFPEYYGNDLESLYDALTDITEETHVSIINRDQMEATAYGSKLIWVFEDAASDNKNITLAWTELESGEYE